MGWSIEHVCTDFEALRGGEPAPNLPDRDMAVLRRLGVPFGGRVFRPAPPHRSPQQKGSFMLTVASRHALTVAVLAVLLTAILLLALAGDASASWRGG
jgi:hypothetical protein